MEATLCPVSEAKNLSKRTRVRPAPLLHPP